MIGWWFSMALAMGPGDPTEGCVDFDAAGRAYDEGVRLFDSADMYGSLPHIAQALKDKPRDSYVLSTKVGKYTDPNEYGLRCSRRCPSRTRSGRQVHRPERVREGHLRLQRSPDPRVAGRELRAHRRGLHRHPAYSRR